MRSHVRLPLHRNAYALVASGSSTALLGLIFWAIAARRYEVHAVGVQSATVSAMVLLAGIAQLGLSPVLIRFLPVAGARSRRLVTTAYLTTALLALATATVFLLGTHLWSPPLAFMRSSGAWFTGFVVATAAFCLFTLQEGVLTGMRRAVWVPLETSLASLSRIVLLVLLAGTFPTAGIFVSWGVTSVLAVVAVTAVLFRRVLPRDAGGDSAPNRELTVRRLVQHAIHNYVGFLFALAAISVLPLIVIARLGAEATAYFFIPWAIYNGLLQVATAISFSLLVEGASDPVRLRSYLRRTLAQALALVVPAAAVVFVAAPQLLGLLGERYAEEGTDLLRWLALASVPAVAIPLTLSLARIRHRTIVVMTTQGCFSALLIGLSIALMPAFGITAVGLGALLGNSAVAAAAGWRYLWPALVGPAEVGHAS
ncbi:MAG TPA: oligosaccharide flippase family protein [Gaiellaceae bacterium]|nr:oligosaccharide flippase family protein [Gaiellaceae bacterium]